MTPHAGFSDADLNKASDWKKTIGATVEPYDEVAYKAGGQIYGAGFEGVFDVPTVCDLVRRALDANSTALYIYRKEDGGYWDLSKCRPCNKKTTETRHGGNESPSYSPF